MRRTTQKRGYGGEFRTRLLLTVTDSPSRCLGIGITSIECILNATVSHTFIRAICRQWAWWQCVTPHCPKSTLFRAMPSESPEKDELAVDDVFRLLVVVIITETLLGIHVWTLFSLPSGADKRCYSSGNCLTFTQAPVWKFNNHNPKRFSSDRLTLNEKKRKRKQNQITLLTLNRIYSSQ